MTVRRDDRAEPDDPAPAGRVDVVNVEAGGRENNAVAAMLTLRRELTRLTAQATAVEQSLEEQRRERADAVTRLQQATERVTELEARNGQLEKELEAARRVHQVTLTELRNVTGERDELALTLEQLRKTGDDELARRNEELARRDDAVRFAEEATKAAETAVARTQEELEDLKRRLTALEVGNADLRTQVEEEEQRSLAKDTELAAMRESQARLTHELETLTKEGLETARRAVGEAQERAADLERELESVRAELERMTAQATAAEQRALEEKIARAGIEQAIFKLRDDVLGAFSHLDEPKAEVMVAQGAARPPSDMGPPDATMSPLDEGWSSGSERPPDAVAPLSVRPKSMRPSASPEMLASIHKSGSVLPVTRRPDSIVPAPPSSDDADPRTAAFARLTDPDRAAEAVAVLRERPEWLRSAPPPALVTALGSVDYDVDNPVFDLARAWEREPMCHALVGAVRSAEDERLREHGAWLLKHLAAPSAWEALADLARSETETPQVRRWLLEALERLAVARAIGWHELGDIVRAMRTHPDPILRDGVVGMVVSLDRSDEKKQILVEMLATESDEAVILSLLHALGTVLPADLEPNVAERLLAHESPRVQRSARDLLERSGQKQ